MKTTRSVPGWSILPMSRSRGVPGRPPWWANLGLLAAYLPVTAVLTASRSIRRGLSASVSSLRRVSDALVIPMVTLTLSAGVFGDVHGRREVFLAGLGHGGDSSVRC